MKKGEPWGRPAEGPPDVEVGGGDDALALAIAGRPAARIAFDPAPTSDFARTVGLTPGGDPVTELPCDALDVTIVDTGNHFVRLVAVNMVVFGVAPDRQRAWSRRPLVHVTLDGRLVHDGPAAAVVIANGQYLRGNDVVPRGHPGDARFEVQVYGVGPRERRTMRSRLRDGTHVPHRDIRSASGARVEVRGAARPVEVDGVGAGRAVAMAAAVLPGAFCLLV